VIARHDAKSHKVLIVLAVFATWREPVAMGQRRLTGDVEGQCVLIVLEYRGSA
jgi:hypothetical protein